MDSTTFSASIFLGIKLFLFRYWISILHWKKESFKCLTRQKGVNCVVACFRWSFRYNSIFWCNSINYCRNSLLHWAFLLHYFRSLSLFSNDYMFWRQGKRQFPPFTSYWIVAIFQPASSGRRSNTLKLIALKQSMLSLVFFYSRNKHYASFRYIYLYIVWV